jgi:hypothetical protein
MLHWQVQLQLVRTHMKIDIQPLRGHIYEQLVHRQWSLSRPSQTNSVLNDVKALDSFSGAWFGKYIDAMLYGP